MGTRARLTILALLVSMTVGAEPTLPQILKGPLTPETIKDVVHAHHADLRACALGRKQQVAGKIVVGFTILPTGKVESVAKRSSTLAEPKLEECLVSTVKGWTFPKPKKGPVEVNFPFRFGPPPAQKPAKEAEPDLLE